MRNFAILILAVIVIVTACNKKSTPTDSRSDMLRNGKWSVDNSSTITAKLGNGKDTLLKYLNFVPPCHRDDYIVFHSNNDAAVFSGGIKCNPGDPDSSTFKWGFTNSDNNLSLYNGFTFVYGVTDTVLTFFHFDTLDHTNIKLDTVFGVLDTTAGYYRSLIVLDTIWDNRFDSLPLPNSNIYNASISDFSQSSFTINFSMYGYRPDTTNHHTGFNPAAGGIDSPVIYRPDTVFYSIKFQNQQ